MKRVIYIAIAILIIAGACTESFDIDLDSTFSRVVIQGSVTNERKAHQVILTRSADYFSEGPAERITGATVTISDGNNILNLTEIEDGVYETDTITGIAGTTYTLDIEAEGRNYTASSLLNECPPIDTITFGYYDMDYEAYEIEDTFVYVLLSTQEPPTPGNFYMWKLHLNGELQTDTLDEYYPQDDVFINGEYLTDVPVSWSENIHKGDTVTLEMLSITEEYYDYVYQVLSVTVWNMGPLGGPAANPKGNVFEVNDDGNDNNNPLGFFSAYSKVEFTTIVSDPKDWEILEY